MYPEKKLLLPPSPHAVGEVVAGATLGFQEDAAGGAGPGVIWRLVRRQPDWRPPGTIGGDRGSLKDDGCGQEERGRYTWVTLVGEGWGGGFC